MQVPGGMVGKAVMFSHFGITRTDVLVRLVRRMERRSSRASSRRSRFVVSASPGQFEVARTYTVLGIEHILWESTTFVRAGTGPAGPRARRLIATLPHSRSRTASRWRWQPWECFRYPARRLRHPSRFPSFSWPARSSMRTRAGRVTQRYPWVVAFTFGLLHGLGFAGALAEVGLPPLAIPTALLFFNVGVEIGQLMFVGVVSGLIAIGWRLARRPRVASAGLALARSAVCNRRPRQLLACGARGRVLKTSAALLSVRGT